MALDWYPNSNHSGIYSAIDEGFFEKENERKKTRLNKKSEMKET